MQSSICFGSAPTCYRNRLCLRRTLQGLLLLLGILLHPALIGAVSTRRTLSVVKSYSYSSLGDSYATGAGAGRPAAVHPIFPTLCVHFTEAYPLQLTSDPAFTGVRDKYLGCGGATTESVRLTQVPVIGRDGGGDDDHESGNGMDMVTVTVGGNEVEFFALVSECVYGWSSGRGCEAQIERSRKLITGLQFRESFEGMVKAVLEGRPWGERRLLVTGYARFFNNETEGCDGMAVKDDDRLTKELRTELNGLVDEINEQIRLASLTQGAEFVDIDGGFKGHRFCEIAREESWFIDLDDDDDDDDDGDGGDVTGNESGLSQGVLGVHKAGGRDLWDWVTVFHPKREGHEAIKQAILDSL